ncbi:MAG: hypothetical protein FJ196_01315 [Gammaproteobacteria bacterium]|nr:hypothetical protein [Gammaproteobacteria bacterium]
MPRQRVLTNAVSGGQEIDIDLLRTPLLQGDPLLLYSNGLSNTLVDTDIAAVLGEVLTSNDVQIGSPAKRLYEAADCRGGLDNISVALATPARISNQT